MLNWIRRALLYVWKHKIKTALLILLTAALVLPVYVCLSIHTAADREIRSIREDVLSEVTLYRKPTRWLQTEGRMKLSRESTPTVSKNAADAVGASKYGKEVNYLLINSIRFEKLTPAGPSAAVRQSHTYGGANAYMAGVRDSQSCAAFLAGGFRLTDGRALGPSDAGKQVALVNRQIAKINSLCVGDSFSVQAADADGLVKNNSKSVTLKIVGFYTAPAVSQYFSNDLPESNYIFVPFTVNQAVTAGGSDSVLQAEYRVDSADHVPAFLAEAKQKLPADCSGCQLATNDVWYSRMAAPLQSVSSASGAAAFVFAAVAFLILGLALVLSLKKRRREIGVLLAIGEKRARIAAQMCVEILVTALIAVCLDVSLTGSIPQTAANSMLTPQVTAAVNRQEGAYRVTYGLAASGGKDPQFTIHGFCPYWNLVNHQPEFAEPAGQISVVRSASVVWAFLGICLLIAVLSVLPTVILIIRTKPRKLLKG